MSRRPNRSKQHNTLLRLGAALVLAVLGLTSRPIAAPVSADSSPALSIGPVSASFYPIDGNAEQFDTSQLGSPYTSSITTFPVIDFNANVAGDSSGGLALSCSNANSGGAVSPGLRAFTDVVPNADGSCTYITPMSDGGPFGTAHASFEAVFTANLYVASAGQVTLNVNSDDGFFMGFGPNINNASETVSAVSGTGPAGAPPTTTVKGYPTVGGNNSSEAPTTQPITFNFPDQGVYPMEVNYTETHGGQQTLVMSYGSNTNAVPIPAQPEVSSVSPLSLNSGSGRSITVTGSNFLPTARLVLTDERGHTTSAGATSVSSDGTSITGAVPTSLTAGTYDVTVEDPARSASSVQSGRLTLIILPPDSTASITQSASATSFAPTGATHVSLADPSTGLAKTAKLSGLGSITLAQYSKNPTSKTPGNRAPAKYRGTQTHTSPFFDLHLSKNACSSASLALERQQGILKQLSVTHDIAAGDPRASKKVLLRFNNAANAWRKLPNQRISTASMTGTRSIQSVLVQAASKATVQPCDVTGDPMVVAEDVTAPAVSVTSVTVAGGPPYTYDPAAFSNQPVTFSVSANDSEDGSTDGSGVASIWYQEDSNSPQKIYDTAVNADDYPQMASGQFTITDDGAHTITIWAVDQAGNGAPTDTDPETGNSTYSPVTANANIDTISPSVTGTPDRSPDANGWYNHGLNVTWSGQDAGSGVSSCDGPTTYSSPDSSAASVTGHCKDNAGNTGTGSLGFLYDGATPTISAQLSGSPAGTGWYNNITGTPTATFSCASSVSGLLASTPCPGSHTFDEGANESYTSPTVTSGSGLTSQPATLSGINVDLTAPSTTSSATTNGNGYTFGDWTNHGVTVTLNAIDTANGLSASQVSGVATTYYELDNGAAQQYTSPVNISTEGIHTLTYNSVDAAGNIEAQHTVTLKIDLTGPVVVPALTPSSPNGTHGWYTSAVSVGWSCSDPALADGNPGSGISSCPNGSTLSQSGGNQSVQVVVRDNAGNTTNASSGPISIDTALPTCSVSLSPSSIWPPNKKMVPVTATVHTSAGPSGASYVLKSLSSNEGDIASESQGWVIGKQSASGALLADRNGGGTGRVYTFTYQVTSGAGLSSTCTGTVTVPHDQGH